MSDETPKRLPTTLSHLLVGLVAAAAVLGVQRCAAKPDPVLPAPAAADDDASGAQAAVADAGAQPQPAATPPTRPPDATRLPGVGDLPATAPAELTQATAPVRIEATPAALRVWHNTRVKLRALPGPGERYDRFVWHFEDGSEPARGAEVEHVFPESVTDRHVTLEASVGDATPLVISKRLPIERLAVVPVDGDPVAPRAIPKVRGLRVALFGAGPWAPSAAALQRVVALGAKAVVIFGAPASAGAAARALAEQSVPVLHVDTTLANPDVPLAEGALARAPVTVVHDPLGRVGKGPGGAFVVLDHVAFVPYDSRPLASNEAAMLALQRALQQASAYPATVLLSARALSPLRDQEVVADRAFRVYEHALRVGVRVAVSSASGVAYDARFGGLAAVAVGRLRPEGCARLAGTDHCQSATVTLLDLPKKGRARALHLRLPSLTAWLGDAELPATVGKYRR